MEVVKGRLAWIYLVLFCGIMLIYNSANGAVPKGEWDDYTLPVASILNDHNFSISAEDVEVYKKLYPIWENEGIVDRYHLSGYMTRGGEGQMPWYFPVYAVACIPFTLLLKRMGVPTVYAFTYTNLAALMISLVFMYQKLRCDGKQKKLLLILLSVNPIVFYIGWPSAEVFIYAMLLLGLTCWHNGWYKRAAIFVSIAGMLNPTIMSLGFFMIAEYMIGLIKSKRNENKTWAEWIKRNVWKIVGYGCCYIPGLIPMLYNYYHIGHINLTASLSGFVTNEDESTCERVISYLFDLNYGILPYYPILLIVSCIFLAFAVIVKSWRYCEWFAAFFVNVALYSIMVHINNGMSGIARYNAWSILILVFAVVPVGLESVLEDGRILTAGRCFLYIGAVVTALVVFDYNPWVAVNTNYTHFTPIAEWTLDRLPFCYNPLHSTFNSRTSHVDGGYHYDTPVAYSAGDGYVRKILATSDDKEKLLADYGADEENEAWFREKIDGLKDSATYISVPSKRRIVKAVAYTLNEPIMFSKEGYNADKYVIKGGSYSQDWGEWSDGKEVIFRMKTDTQADSLHLRIDCGVYNKVQDVTVYCNGEEKYHNDSYVGEGIEFDFKNPGVGENIEFRISIPNAISPRMFGYNDIRTLGLAFRQMLITEK